MVTNFAGVILIKGWLSDTRLTTRRLKNEQRNTECEAMGGGGG